MRHHPWLVGLLWRWHRRLGLLAAVFVLVLAVTGILLNHSPGLGLDRRFVDSPWLRQAYGDDSADLPAFRLGGHWLSQGADGKVYFDTLEVAPCAGRLVAAVEAQGMLLAGCSGELLLIAPSGQLIESASASTGLPSPLRAVGLAGDAVVVQDPEGWWLADLEAMDFRAPAPGGSLINQLSPGALPEAIRRGIPSQEQWLSWERLLLDLHSGRIAGRLGILWVDLVGVLSGGLALSGIAMWWLRGRGRRLRRAAGRTGRG
jgi:hypothetical protein